LQQKDAELEHVKTELNDIHTALKVLIEHHQTDVLSVQNILEQEINQEIFPFLEQLKKGKQDFKQLTLLRILEENLNHLVSSYGVNNSLSRAFQELTPKEIQVACMIRQGFSTKHIAETLSTSEGTISTHRRNIRKKLGLNNASINLRSHLGLFD
jgi:DNA-binding NarL/FixJ family response regulator